MPNARWYSFGVGDREILTWPDHVAIEIFNSQPVMGLVRFDDTNFYHPRLIEYILGLEADSDFTRPIEGGANQVNELQDWDIVEADLVNARALKLCNSLMNSDKGQIVSAYALVFRNGDYLPPRNPENAVASVTYLVDPGDAEPGSGSSGRLSFTHRHLEEWTAKEPQNMAPGVMLAYPAGMLSTVLPYAGQRPRILLNWHIVV